MSFEIIIAQITSDFIKFFNKRDFDSLRKLLTNDFYTISDSVKKVYPENTDGKIAGLENVIAYWEKYTSAFPDVKIESGNYKISHEGKNITYEGRLENGKEFISRFVMNEYAKIESLVSQFMNQDE